VTTDDERSRKAAYQRRWRAKQGARTGELGRPPSQPCGTVAAYKRHRRNDETPCAACRAANAAHHRDLYRRRKGGGQPPT
jgi:hypothetical protein